MSHHRFGRAAALKLATLYGSNRTAADVVEVERRGRAAGAVDVLIANVGRRSTAMSVNLTAPFLSVQRIVPGMRMRR
ncbi:hypothetical protein BC936DRAFT_147933 [Jimgerdemannia flammicorona]|uniref:Uncharacterized protein n=1 Tax=Jimgerdemannia flammicorona TaxID=994334 RepID=A0A433D475_9FUNG|nr:hypothetical protein BC936DRAFT_147933 [Jimgerdemannia flammicorona]